MSQKTQKIFWNIFFWYAQKHRYFTSMSLTPDRSRIFLIFLNFKKYFFANFFGKNFFKKFHFFQKNIFFIFCKKIQKNAKPRYFASEPSKKAILEAFYRRHMGNLLGKMHTFFHFWKKIFIFEFSEIFWNFLKFFLKNFLKFFCKKIFAKFIFFESTFLILDIR